MSVTKQQILDLVSDTVSSFLYYDRKEGEDFPRGSIEKAIDEGVITVTEIEFQFGNEIRKSINNEKV